MNKELKAQTISGVLWSTIEQFGLTIVKFIFGIILARLLMPSDFGLVGMVTIFFEFANEIMQGGFSQAYIQKQNVTKKDKASVYYFNVFFGFVLYLIFWIIAPSISKFYNQPELTTLIRVMSVVVIIDSFAIIRLAEIIKAIDFKKRTLYMLISTVISGAISMYMAYADYGVWALVFYTVINKLLFSLLLWIGRKPIPFRDFSFKSLRSMFSFGGWLVISSILGKLQESMVTMVTGKFYSPAELGYFTRAQQYQRLSAFQFTIPFVNVAFPVFAKINNDSGQQIKALKKFNQQSLLAVLFVVLPFFVVAKPFVLLLLTDKWLPMVGLLQLFCIMGVFVPIEAINNQYIISIGQSKTIFRLIVIKLIMRVLNLLITYKLGLVYIVIGELVIIGVSYYLSCMLGAAKIGYGFLKQIIELKHLFMGAIISVCLGIAFVMKVDNSYLQLAGGIIITLIVFVLFQVLFNREVFELMLGQVKKIVIRERK